MLVRFAIVLACLAIFLSGCATPPQQPIQMDLHALKSGRIGVAMTHLPKVDTYLPGTGCLLCMAAAAATNSTLTTHAQTLPYEDLPKIKNAIADLMRKKGMEVTVIEEDIDLEALGDFGSPGQNVARKDFSSVRKKYNIEKLVVININALGFIRTYSSYFPTSEPKGYLRGAGYMVNLSNNTYEWYLPVEITRSADRNWDEPPKYPGLTNVYFQVLEIGKDTFLSQFRR
jgi:hypothetical protein